MPVTIPDIDPTVAIEVLELDHVPPLEEFESVVVAPIHTILVPAIVEGAALIEIVTIASGVQPLL
jgi:hypothetical protein